MSLRLKYVKWAESVSVERWKMYAKKKKKNFPLGSTLSNNKTTTKNNKCYIYAM